MARIVVTLRRFEKRRLLKWAAKQRDPGVRLRVRIVLLYAEDFGCDRIAHALNVAVPSENSTRSDDDTESRTYRGRRATSRHEAMTKSSRAPLARSEGVQAART